MRTITYAQAIKEALEQEMRRDPSVVLYGEDVANFGGIFQITSGLQEQFGEERVFDTPISENAFVGAAVGAAITGLRPVVELQFADFLFTTGDEIVLKAGMWRYVHGGAYKVPMVVRCPSGAAGVGPEHGQCPEAFFMHSPGLRIVSPSTPADAKGLLKSAIRDDNPVLYFEHKLLYATKGEVPEDPDYLVPLGKAAVRREGDALTLVAISAMVPKALKVAERLAKEGHNIEVMIPARSIRSIGRRLSNRSRRPVRSWSPRKTTRPSASAQKSARCLLKRRSNISIVRSSGLRCPMCRSRQRRYSSSS